jgi:Fe-Mn family superoxide dismutase
MFTLPDLPYAYDALEPAISERTLHFHHDKHHRTYVETLNDLLAKTGAAPSSLEMVISKAAKDKDARKLFNNAAQAWNHGFFWRSMTATRSDVGGELGEGIDRTFGGLSGLGKLLVEQGAAHFGSGWAWLVVDADGKLEVETTHDAQDMVTEAGKTPLLVCDLWEHAYYLDYQNDRKKFLQTWFDDLTNWDFAAEQFAAAASGEAGWRYPAPSAHAHAA